MRAIVLILSLAAPAVLAQLSPEPGIGACNVLAKPRDVNDAGEFVQPPPTPDECLFAADLVSKLLRADRRELRRVTSTRIPEPVRPEIGAGVNRRAIETWVSDELVVVAYQSMDFTGLVTNVLVADLASGTACHYPRWPADETPGQLSLEDIQDVLDGARSGDERGPTCYLRQLAEN
ncbi:MAG TPA: hypothetical protein VMR74_06320 [Gammaproteobacteria bacterium]|nr:hypothetical protein [Gammaproteobacteria bacterium]